jgi:hypothetical protein
MTDISDEYMGSMLTTAKPYCIVLLKPVEKTGIENLQEVLWEHGRRNFALRAAGKLSIVAPVTKESDVAGLYVFNTSEEEAAEILGEDPAIRCGIFTFVTYPCMSFPGDSLK